MNTWHSPPRIFEMETRLEAQDQKEAQDTELVTLQEVSSRAQGKGKWEELATIAATRTTSSRIVSMREGKTIPAIIIACLLKIL
jgi:hypothetical protein